MLHQDVSVGNVMLTEARSGGSEKSGILNDWDRAEGLDSLSEDCRMVSFPLDLRNVLPLTVVQGTWQYASVTLMQDFAKPHDVIDDIESVLWVLIAVALRRFEYTGDFPMTMFDEEHHPMQGGRTGGILKSFWVGNPPNADFGCFECHPLEQLFTHFRAFHDAHLQKFRDSRKRDGPKDALEALKRCRDEITKNLGSLLTIFDEVLDDPTADWKGGIPISSSDKKTTQIPDVAIQPTQTHDRKRKRDNRNDADNSRPKKRANVTNTQNTDDKDKQPPKPSRKKRTTVPLPRKVYNLRPRAR